MLPRLQAEESIRAANRVALGSGTLKDADRRALVADWQATAAGSRQAIGRIGGPLFQIPKG